jgi:hypothetical protein
MSLAVAEKQREARRRWSAENVRKGQDIGDIPPVVNPARRLACSRSFRLHCETYHRPTFSLEWSEDHLTVIRQMEAAIFDGELFATAMPRGSGKTSLAEVAVEFATINGYHPFACLLGSDEAGAESMLESIKTEFEINELLAADYPEVCLPITKLDGIPNRCKGQSYRGERTRIEWTAKTIVLPSVKPEGWAKRKNHRDFLRPDGHSLGSGAILKVAGITGGIRGMKHKRADGETVRPTLIIPDDPQTDQSARSPSQCQTRERILKGAVLGLAGPGKKIAGVMPCTVIQAGDLADTFLDRSKHPEWHGTRTKMVYAFPADEKLWEEYRRIRAEDMEAERGTARATEFYRTNREAMDAGSRVAWPARHNDDELSAIQHAMNLKFDRGDRAFAAEYQNEPLPEEESRPDDLTPDQILGRLNRHKRGLVPLGCNRLTAFIDVQASLLYYAVAAWEDDFTGYIVDYGAWPDQKRPYFTLRDAKHPISDVIKHAGLEGQIYGGLEKLTNDLLGREWPRDDQATLRIERCLIDANWGTSTRVIKQFCRQSAHSAVLTPSHGRGIGASGCPMAEWPKKPGERRGLNWRLRGDVEVKGTRSVIYDTNFWKAFLLARLSVAMGDRGGLSLYGDKADTHRMLADHLTAEYRVRTEGRGRTVDEFKQRPERPDNHFFDCVVGCAVAASMQGVALAEPESRSPVVAKPRSGGWAAFKARQSGARP